MESQQFKTPGQYLEALLHEKGWSQRVLSLIGAIEDTRVNKIIHNKLAVDAKLALKLGEIFEVDPTTFLDLQQAYDLAKARIEYQPDDQLEKRIKLFGELPIAAMIKRGWLRVDNIRNANEIENELIKFFGVSSASEIEVLPHAPKKTDIATSATPAQIVWLYRARRIAQDIFLPKYCDLNLGSLLNSLSELLVSQEAVRKVPKLLAEYGIRFVFVEALPSSKIDGACFWLDHNSPVIAMSLRFDRIDNFWFVLRHELEHIRRKHGQQIILLDTELEKVQAAREEEKIANEAALEFCVPQASLDSFVIRKSPFFREDDIIGFARKHGRHPGLVIGQIQHRTGRYDLFIRFLVKIRKNVLQGAYSDGWGSDYPFNDSEL